MELSQVVLFGNVQVTTQALRALCERGIPVVYYFPTWIRSLD